MTTSCFPYLEPCIRSSGYPFVTVSSFGRSRLIDDFAYDLEEVDGFIKSRLQPRHSASHFVGRYVSDHEIIARSCFSRFYPYTPRLLHSRSPTPSLERCRHHLPGLLKAADDYTFVYIFKPR